LPNDDLIEVFDLHFLMSDFRFDFNESVFRHVGLLRALAPFLPEPPPLCNRIEAEAARRATEEQQRSGEIGKGSSCFDDDGFVA
jgi:hypothetical protein